jgi:predicted Fe-Mo cluster-binding NifX family protein
MKIAIPLWGGRLSPHFGHCETFAILEADPQTRTVTGDEVVDSPPHQPGLLPGWLHGMGVSVIIAGGMGRRALGLFAQHGIEVVVGAEGGLPHELAEAYLDGTLATGDNICDH